MVEKVVQQRAKTMVNKLHISDHKGNSKIELNLDEWKHDMPNVGPSKEQVYLKLSNSKNNPEAGHRGISLLVVERDMAGFTRGRNLDKLGMLYQPIWTSAIDSPRSFSLAVILFGGLQFWKIPSWILVITGGIAGGLFL
jgi:hypothetical protein